LLLLAIKSGSGISYISLRLLLESPDVDVDVETDEALCIKLLALSTGFIAPFSDITTSAVTT
jgi:hypothetical protein